MIHDDYVMIICLQKVQLPAQTGECQSSVAPVVNSAASCMLSFAVSDCFHSKANNQNCSMLFQCCRLSRLSHLRMCCTAAAKAEAFLSETACSGDKRFGGQSLQALKEGCKGFEADSRLLRCIARVAEPDKGARIGIFRVELINMPPSTRFSPVAEQQR